MKSKTLILLLLITPYCLVSQESELIDIKPIYRSYNYSLLIFSLLILATILTFLVTFIFKKIKNRHQEKITEEYNWELILNNLSDKKEENPKLIESELIHLLKVFLEKEHQLKVISLFDKELLDRVKKSDKFVDVQKEHIENFIKSSESRRFAPDVDHHIYTSNRIDQLREIIHFSSRTKQEEAR